MMATTCSFLRSFITAELSARRARRAVVMTRAMNMDLFPVGRCRADGGREDLSGRATRAQACAWLVVELLADLREHLGAEELDALEEVGVRHAADIHLQDLAVVAEQLVEVEDAV